MSAHTDFEERLQLLQGQSSDALCRVYARDTHAQGDLQLTGSLTGPECAYAATLPATYRLVDRGPGASLLAEAVVPEPCYWTPEMPHLYRAEVRLEQRGDVLASTSRPLGLRRLGTNGSSLLLEGERWVVRAAAVGTAPRNLGDWHDVEMALAIRNPDDELCEQASRVGVLLVALLAVDEVSQLVRLARWPAVGIAILPATAVVESPPAGLLLAQHVTADRPIEVALWANILAVDLAGERQHQPAAKLPMLAIRSTDGNVDASTARAACDRLQRDLAGTRRQDACDPAGYIV